MQYVLWMIGQDALEPTEGMPGGVKAGVCVEGRGGEEAVAWVLNDTPEDLQPELGRFICLIPCAEVRLPPGREHSASR